MEAEGTDTSCFGETLDKCFVHQEPQQKRSSAAAAINVPQSSTGPQFDCSICFDFAVEPVVTLCGHLYCWPCIYKWLQVGSTSPRRQCPVCKEPVSQNALVPLYGRGPTNPRGSHKSLGIPNRPSMIGGGRHFDDECIDMRAPAMHQNYYPWQVGSSSVFGSTAGGVIGGLAVYVLPMLSRSNYVARPYLLETNRFTARERRRERLVEESLHQLWVFLFCGAILCLLFF